MTASSLAWTALSLSAALIVADIAGRSVPPLHAILTVLQ